MEIPARRVAIVEDDAMMRAFVSRYLGADYELTEFSDGGDVLPWLEGGEQPHLLILDLSMPVTGGMEVLSWVRERPHFDPMAVMILSGEDSSESRVSCLEAGADDFLVKPFNPRELLARVRNLLRRSG